MILKNYTNKFLFFFWMTLQFGSEHANGQLSPAQSYARNRPGVVMIKTNFTATIYLKQVIFDNTIFNGLLDSISTIESGGIKLSAEQKLDIVVQEFNNRASVFFKSTADYRRHTQLISISGTGFIITENGYVVTNSHVVNESDEYITKKFILSAFQQVTETNIKALETAWAVVFNSQQKEFLYNAFAKVYSSIKSILLENLQKNIYVIYATDTLNSQPAIKTTSAQLIKKGQSMPGKDIAILKIEASKPLPTLRMVDNVLVRTGDRIYVYGFPDPVTKNQYLSIESLLEPSLTAGIVSGVRKTVNGWNVVQMDADINHGNSGGPVCDEDGAVIGIATFGSIEASSGTLAAGMNFSLPVNIIKEFLDTLNIVPRQGNASLLFNRAMDDYDNEEYSRALSKIRQLQKLNPAFPGLSTYINDCNLKIENGLDKTRNRIKLWMLICGLAILVFVLFRVRKFFINRKLTQNKQQLN